MGECLRTKGYPTTGLISAVSPSDAFPRPRVSSHSILSRGVYDHMKRTATRCGVYDENAYPAQACRWALFWRGASSGWSQPMVFLALLQWLLVHGVQPHALPFVSAPGSHRGVEGDGDGCAFSLFLVFRSTSDIRTLDRIFQVPVAWCCCMAALPSCGDDAARHVPACVVAKGAAGLR